MGLFGHGRPGEIIRISGSGLDNAAKLICTGIVSLCSAWVPDTHASVTPVPMSFGPDALASLAVAADPDDLARSPVILPAASVLSLSRECCRRVADGPPRNSRTTAFSGCLASKTGLSWILLHPPLRIFTPGALAFFVILSGGSGLACGLLPGVVFFACARLVLRVWPQP